MKFNVLCLRLSAGLTIKFYYNKIQPFKVVSR